MRSKIFVVSSLVLVGLIAFAAGYSTRQESKASSRVYELRTYTTLPGRLPALHKRFAEHTIKLFEKHGMKNGMYWTPTDDSRNALKENVLVYFVSHESQEAAEKSWKDFQADPEWIKVRDA